MNRTAARSAALLLAALLVAGGALASGASASAAPAASTAAVVAGAATAAPVVKPGTVAISGSGLVGTDLTATTTGWTPGTVTFSYQWSVGGRVVAGATTATYRPVAADAGRRVTVRITGTSPGAAPASRVASLAASVSTPGSIGGTVFETGSPAAPVARGDVTLYAAYAIAGRPTDRIATVSIINGRYLLPGVLPGQYTLEFRNVANGQKAFLGGGTIASASTALTVTSGRVTTKNFTFSDTGSISGSLTLDGPAPAPDDYFSVEATSSRGANSTEVAPDGTFTITGLPVGSYTVTVSAYNGADHTSIYSSQTYSVSPTGAPGRISVAAGRTVSGLSISMKPAATVSGIVTEAGTGLPVPFANIEVYRLDGTAVSFNDEMPTGADGRFTLAHIDPGTYRLRVSPAAGEGLGPVWIGGTSFATARVFTLRNGDVITGIAVALPAAP